MPDQFNVVVVGGGVIGACIAWRCACEGRRVLLLDARHVGSEASSAAAGMLAPGGEFDDPSMLDFGVRSLAKYEEFVTAVQADSGLSIEFRRTGAVQIAMTREELDVLADRAERQRTAGIPSTILSRDELRTLVPAVRPDAVAAVHYTGEAIVNPAALMASLRAACIARGVTTRENSPVSSVSANGGCVQVSARGTTFEGDFAVLAAGAWCGEIAVSVDGQPSSLPETFPVKGHLLGFRLPPGSFGATVRHEHTYVLQRADGFSIAGSSSEQVGFSRAIDPRIVSDIAARASALVPALASLQPESVWIGFRPGAHASAPNIGRLGSSRLLLAYGHYRNGILLGPETADRIWREIDSVRS